MSARSAAGTLLAAAVLAGCGGGGDDEADTPTQTTRVEVLQDAPAPSGGVRFDPAGIYRRESPGVVTIVSGGLNGNAGGGSGLGSGFVISAGGEVATNAHVVTSGEGAAIRKADEVYVRFQDGNQVSAEIVGFDPFTDVALLKIDPKGLTLRPLPLGSAGDLVVGSPVAAIGSPFGEEQSLSVGVISALDRSIQSLTGFATTGAIQTDAAINQDNSGGPMLDARGRVLGINAQIQTTTGEGSGVGFAVSVDTVKRSLRQLRANGEVRYAYFGVATTPVYPQLADEFDLAADDGAWLQQVTPGGPADDAGLRGGERQERFQDRAFQVGGDVIVTVAGRRLRDDSDLSEVISTLRPGQRVRVEIVRDGDRRTVQVRLGERPLDAPRAG
jgi:S1-C subfamily serine protease